jgi:hypothetical protein
MDFVHGMPLKYTTMFSGRSMLEDVDWPKKTNVRDNNKSTLLQNIDNHVKPIFHVVALKITAHVQQEQLSATPAQRPLLVLSSDSGRPKNFLKWRNKR